MINNLVDCYFLFIIIILYNMHVYLATIFSILNNFFSMFVSVDISTHVLHIQRDGLILAQPPVSCGS